MNTPKPRKQFNPNLRLLAAWEFLPSEPPPKDLPVKITTALGGPTAVVDVPNAGIVYTLHPHEWLLLVDDGTTQNKWLVLNAISALTLLQEVPDGD